MTKWEIWFIRMAFGPAGRAIRDAHDLTHEMHKLRFLEVDEVVDSLIAKNVLDRSPNGRQLRMTELGIESFNAAGRAQVAWEKDGPLRATTAERGVVLINAGDTFAADRLIRDVLRRASRELAIIDAYVGTSLFDHLDDLPTLPDVRILTSDAINAATRTAHAAFRKKHAQVEMRIAAPGILHDRFVLWDKVGGATFGHSLKDLGKKDAQVTWLKDAAEQWRLLETRWGGATPA